MMQPMQFVMPQQMMQQQMLPQQMMQQQMMPQQMVQQQMMMVATPNGNQAMMVPVMCVPQQPMMLMPSLQTVDLKTGLQHPLMKCVDNISLEARSHEVSSDHTSSTTEELVTPVHNQQQGNSSVAVLSAILRASGNTPVTGLAGALAKRLRNKQEVVIEAMGPTSVAQAMRAMILARSFLFQEGIMITGNSDFMFAPSREAGSVSPHPGLRFTVNGVQTPQEEPKYDDTLNITDESVVGKAAGAISKLVRSTGSRGGVLGLTFGPSPGAINLAAKAITLSRAMLVEDNLDIKIQPMMPKSVYGSRIQPEEQVLEFAVTTYIRSLQN
eukprot:TRINITY_DN816_c10_g1_i1.p1 TRINITY_DN816_c10_g1~~TRINITY_DN816_c10_g1_i1.p1  ORF type:complete len:326 (+),score=102.80 TRINITY_DN816_c10_g1_i1:62-1039(+)